MTRVINHCFSFVRYNIKTGIRERIRKAMINTVELRCSKSETCAALLLTEKKANVDALSGTLPVSGLVSDLLCGLEKYWRPGNALEH